VLLTAAWWTVVLSGLRLRIQMMGRGVLLQLNMLLVMGWGVVMVRRD
jgi:hypothetical protein